MLSCNAHTRCRHGLSDPSPVSFMHPIAALPGQGVLRQWSEEPTGIFLAFVLFAAGSLVPLLSGSPASVQAQKIGPFNRDAEMLNGRAAMIGFASLLVIEAVKGTPLF